MPALLALAAFLLLISAPELALLRRPYHDSAPGHLVTRVLISDSIRSGSWPFWEPFARYARPLSTIYTALNWNPLGVLLAAFWPYDVWTLVLENTLWKAVGLTGTYLFARRHVRSWWAAVAVAIGYVGGALVTTSQAALGTTWAYLIAPWLLVAVDAAIAASNWRAWCRATGLLALTGAGLVTNGYPGTWLTAPFFVAPYALWMAGPSWRALARIASAAIASAALAAGMVALFAAETAINPLFGPGAARNAISPVDGYFQTVNALSLWLVNPGYLESINVGVLQHQYLGLIPALLLCASAPARWRTAIRTFRPVALAAIAFVAARDALALGEPIVAARVGEVALLLALFVFPWPFRRWERNDVALLLAGVASAVAATSNPVADFLRLHVLPFSIIRWNTWYLWIAALALSVIAWRTLEQLLSLAPSVSWRQVRRSQWWRGWLTAALFLTALYALAALIARHPEPRTDQIGLVNLAWTVALLALWTLGAAAFLLRRHSPLPPLLGRAEVLLLAGACAGLAGALIAGHRFAANEELVRAFITLPGGATYLLDVAHVVVILAAAAAVGLRAGSRQALARGLLLVAMLDMSLASPRYGADTEMVVVGQSPARIERDRRFGFTGNQRTLDENTEIWGTLTKEPTMVRLPSLLPHMATFDDAMGSPSIFRQLTYFPASWSPGVAGSTDVFVQPEAFRAATWPPPASSLLIAHPGSASGQPASACAAWPAGAPATQAAPSAIVTRLLPDRVTIEAHADCERLLVYTDTWSPGWQVRIDGRPAQALRVNEAIRGVIVPAGRHEVEWLYRTPHLGVWLAIMAISAAITMALLLAPSLESCRGKWRE